MKLSQGHTGVVQLPSVEEGVDSQSHANKDISRSITMMKKYT